MGNAKVCLGVVTLWTCFRVCFMQDCRSRIAPQSSSGGWTLFGSQARDFMVLNLQDQCNRIKATTDCSYSSLIYSVDCFEHTFLFLHSHCVCCDAFTVRCDWLA